jgi:glycosyltransferase involved in cell wall biosynthesis
MPIVVIKAMFVGTPVIASNVSGMPELIENNFNGILVPAGDVSRLKDAILELISKKELTIHFVRESVKKAAFFNIDRMIKDYENLYKRLMSESSLHN